MRIKKTSQYIEGGASLSNVYGTSDSNGYAQEYINNLHTYSTTEQRIGTWIDGKPLYRKVFTGQFEGGTSTSTTVFDILPLTCTVRNLYGTTIQNGGSANRRPINFYFEYQGVSSYIGTWAIQDVNNNRWNLAFYYSQGYNTLNYEVVIEYTKTTD